MPRKSKPRSHKHRKQHYHRRKQTPTFTKAATDLTRMAVTGLVGSGVIASTGAAIKNLTG